MTKSNQPRFNRTSQSEGGLAGKSERLLSLDGLRGVIMIFMALDHANYFITKIHPGEFWGVALPQYHSALEFLTRFVTHICAPGFFFLMGAGMVLFAESRENMGWSKGRIVRFFTVRGLLLIAFQFLLENQAWRLGYIGGETRTVTPPGGGGMPDYYFGVLYALGGSMMVAAVLTRLRWFWLILISLGCVLATEALTPPARDAHVLYSPVARMLLIPGYTNWIIVFYPLIPWLGITLLGLVFGKALLKDRVRSFHGALIAGLGFLLLFPVLRWATGFGSFHPFDGTGWISFLNVTKYPPSLTFILITLGLDFILLYLLQRAGEGIGKWGRPLITFGRTPLFFYIVHLYLFALLGFLFPKGTTTAVMYPFWAAGLVILYPLCRWYGHFKLRTAPESVWRFF